MALQGTLRDFSITEIIQLIGQQLKTGVLRIRRRKKSVEIYFVDGMIVHVFSNYRGKKDLIGEILVKAKLITEDQLERVLRIQRGTNKYLGEILVELQLLTKDDVLKVISTQIYETIYDLFWWEDGTFNFDLKLVESYKKIPFALSTEQVLLNILRMVDEGAEIEKRIHSPHLVFQKTVADRSGAKTMASQRFLKEKLTSEQEMVYNLINGNRTVEEIVDRSLLGKFNTSEILNSLLDMGLTEVVGVQTPSLVQKVSKVDLRGYLDYAHYGIILLFLLMIFFYVKPGIWRHVRDTRIAPVEVDIPVHFLQKAQLHRVKTALEIYSLERGTYPGRLEDLVTAGLLRDNDLHSREGISYQYELKDNHYLLKP